MNILTKIRQCFYQTTDEQYSEGMKWATYICATANKKDIISNFEKCGGDINDSPFDWGARYVFLNYLRDRKINPYEV